MTQLPASAARAIVRTPDFAEVQILVAEVVAANGVGLVSGDPGLGKTEAVEQALAKVRLPIYRMVIPAKITAKALVLEMLLALGYRTDRRHTEAALRLDLVEALSAERLVFLFDECKGVGVEGLRMFHYLREATRTAAGPAPWSLFLVGTDIDAEVSNVPALGSRVMRRQHFEAWPESEVIANLHALDPLFSRLDGALLLEIDEIAHHGNFRSWSLYRESLAARVPDNGRRIGRDKAFAALLPIQGSSPRRRWAA
jgi:hypothetical protein